MDLKVELQESPNNVLIVDKILSPLVKKLKLALIKYENKIFISPKVPKNLEKFNLIFFVDIDYPISHLVKNSSKKIIFILKTKNKMAEKLAREIHRFYLKNVKIITIADYGLSDEEINNVLWFSFSKSKEILLKISQPLLTGKINNNHPRRSFSKILTQLILHHHFKKTFSIKKILFASFILLFIFHILFFLPLVASSLFLYKGVKNLSNFKITETKNNLSSATYFFNFSKKLYDFPRHTFLLFSVAEPIDNLFQMNEKANLIANQSIAIYENAQEIMKLFLNMNKSFQEKSLLKQRLNKVQDDLENFNENLVFFNQKLPSTFPLLKKAKIELTTATELISKAKQFFPHINNLLAKDSEKKYLLLFANNMEIRPGGGFIGSFGVVTVKDFTLTDIKIYDVYDADGQLLSHVEPPPPIKNYLNQPHWFLRDSAFSPDFADNYSFAKSFLDKEMKMSDFSGGILLTTSSIKYLLSAFNKVYLPDFNELVTADNFYLKAQVYSEKNFFHGSTQKKSFLGSLTRQIIINIENVPILKLVQALKKSLDEKQMVVYFDSPPLEDLVKSLFWSGKIIEPQCPQNLTNCYPDYISAIDANLGVNKSNFFVNRTMELTVSLDQTGYVNNSFVIKFENQAQGDVFPGGIYRNYFQFYIPASAILKQITKDDVLVEDYDVSIDQFKKIGFLFELPPKSSTEIKIEYQSSVKLTKGRAYYQVLVQKQTGSSNNDLTLRIYLPKNVHLLNQNFSPLVKDNLILYNTQLSTDKIFFTELLSE